MQASIQETIDYFSLNGLVYRDADVTVNKVYDGDSITLILPFAGKMYKWRCRLLGIDTPEIRGGTTATKEKGYAARDVLRDILMDTDNLTSIVVSCHEFDKYGRVLIRLSVNHKKYGAIGDVSTWLVENGYGEAYMV
jgi:endonuclease YncB( thermonuclease family)